jgi:hypothetical protein
MARWWSCPPTKCVIFQDRLQASRPDGVSENWRLTFAFEGEDAILVDYQDYH